MDERDVEDDAGRDGAHEPVGDDGPLLTSRVGERNGESGTDAHKVETGSEGTKGTRGATSDVIQEDVHKKSTYRAKKRARNSGTQFPLRGRGMTARRDPSPRPRKSLSRRKAEVSGCPSMTERERETSLKEGVDDNKSVHVARVDEVDAQEDGLQTVEQKGERRESTLASACEETRTDSPDCKVQETCGGDVGVPLSLLHLVVRLREGLVVLLVAENRRISPGRERRPAVRPEGGLRGASVGVV